LKGRGPVDTLRCGEVAEWLNAAVSKTVTSVIPASGVRIPPSPLLSTLRPAASACQHGAGFARRLVSLPVHREADMLTSEGPLGPSVLTSGARKGVAC
jgi:hypothetical protein